MTACRPASAGSVGDHRLATLLQDLAFGVDNPNSDLGAANIHPENGTRFMALLAAVACLSWKTSLPPS